MPSLWKKLFIIVAVLLVVSLVLGGNLWQRLTAIESQLAETTEQWKNAETRLESKIGEGNWLVEHYSEIQKQARLRLGEGQDAQRFITPDDPSVAAKVQEITGGYGEDSIEGWADAERLYSWLVRNIEYAADTYTPLLPNPPDETVSWQGGFWRMPAETIKDKAGDCEDMSALLISMLLNYNGRRNPVWGIGIESTKPEPSRHIAVAIPVENNQLTILDPTAHYNTTFPSGWGIAAKESPVAIGEWLARWSEKMPEARIYMVFSEDVYREFQSTEEFLEWVKSLKF